MTTRGCGLLALTLLLMAGLVVPGGAAADPGGSGGRVAAAGGFSDVSGVHAPAIEALAAEGVLDGTDCGAGLFCPDEPLQRSVMAVWLVRMLDGAGSAPAASGVFSDVDYGNVHAPYADRLAELDVTRGCAVDPLRYCPDDNVTRGQMAAFLVRAFDLEAGPDTGFTDVGDGHTFAADIDALAASRVTAGCSATPLRFCPDRHVTRAQMATFLARAAGLVELPAPVGGQPDGPPAFDPFTTPTVSDIDLDRLADAVQTLDPDADCPPTAVPASLDDVAEVVRITGGCLNVEYMPLGGRTVAQVREDLASDPEVHAVGLPVTDVFPVDFHSDGAGMDQWHLEAIGADVLWSGGRTQDGRGVGGWPAGADVVVAVIDTGVDGAHRDLDGNLVTSVNMCHRTDPDGHGTHVAGIVAAERNGQDVAGVAPRAQILPIRLSPVGSCLFSATAAVELAIEQGADVINMSFWWGTPDDLRQTEIDLSRQDTFEAVLRAAMMHDIVPVIAAGNCGVRGHSSCFDNNVYVPNRVILPAAYSGVISVASIDDDGERSDFSTANRHVGIAAPGRDIRSTFPNNGTALLSGTSMAAPVISGVVAHMKARFPKASVSEIRQALYATAVNPVSGRTGHWTEEYGWGVVQPAEAILDLTERFFSCDGLLESGDRLVAYDIDVDIDADGDTIDDDRVGLFDRRDVWLADEAGTDWCRLAHNSVHPAWSPDGEHLAFAHRLLDPIRNPATNEVDSGQVDIWVLPIGGGSWRRVTNTEVEEYDLDWSVDGQIAYTADAGGGPEIWVVDAAGTGAPRNVTAHIVGSQYQPSWSPDGTRIVYASNSDGDDDIWVMDADGTNPRKLTGSSISHDGRVLADRNEKYPAWSPDGTRIVYESDRSGGDPDIWVMNTDGSGHRILHDNNNPERRPAWSHDGTRILFVHNTGDSDDDIWAMDAQTGEDWKLITTATANDLRFNAAAESNPAMWAPAIPDDREVQITWGSDAGGRANCPTDTTCWNLQYEYIGSWDAPPYTLECWANGRQGWVGQWTGRPATGCYYWNLGTAHVIIDGVRSNVLAVPEQPAPDDRAVRISWGSDAGGRANCPDDLTCWNLEYDLVGSWEAPPYTLECWANGRQGWVGQWTGRPATGCYYWAGTAHVIIDGVRSNQLTVPVPEGDPPIPGSSDVSLRITAGLHHACALRADGTAVCWGADVNGEGTPPGGVFTALSAGSQHTCGLRTDGTVECWGYDGSGESTPPGGSFSAVSAGFSHTCGVRTGGTVECWGTNDFAQTDAPSGSFVAVASAVLHTCGLATGGMVECWGTHFPQPAGNFEQISPWCGIRTDGTVDCFMWFINPPDGRFTALSSGRIFYQCGLNADGTVECWDTNYSGESTPPDGTFLAVASGWDFSCGIRTSGTLDCWGYNDGRTTPPAGTFTNVAVSGHSCAVKTDGTVECWGQNRIGEASPPQGAFTKVDTGNLYTCGLRVGGTIECWGSSGGGQAKPPTGIFTDLAVGSTHGCGIRTNRTIECWGNNDWGQATPPSGEFIAITADHSAHSCGIRTDGTIGCWGDAENSPTLPNGTFTAISGTCGIRADGTIQCWGPPTEMAAPQGRFTALTNGGGYHCGIRTDGTIQCWGYNPDGRATPPAGTFTSIDGGWEHTCGIRTDGTIQCWGYSDGRTTPPGGRFGPPGS